LLFLGNFLLLLFIHNLLLLLIDNFFPLLIHFFLFLFFVVLHLLPWLVLVAVALLHRSKEVHSVLQHVFGLITQNLAREQGQQLFEVLGDWETLCHI
jgi:hypothetical protein